MRLPTLALIAQAVFILERGHTDRHKVGDATGYATHASATAGVSNNLSGISAKVVHKRQYSRTRLQQDT